MANTVASTANGGKDTSVNFMLGPLQPYLDASDVTEICVNRPFEVFVERQGKWCSYDVPELSYDHLMRLGVAVATFANSVFGESTPIVSAVLPHGERSQFVMPPACKDGTISITIRKPGFTVRTLDSYVKDGFFDHVCTVQELPDADQELLNLGAQMQDCETLAELAQKRANFLIRAVELGKNIVIAGETGSGKTT